MATTRIPLTQPLCLLYYATGATRKIPHRGLDQPTLLLSPRLSSNCREQSLDLLSGPCSSPRFPLTYAEKGREPDGDGDDIAVCDFDADDLEPYKFSYVTPASFLTKETIEQHNIGPGDDVFMTGRFLPHEGRERNIPVLRFGNISMMPREPIRHPTRGIDQESYLVEMRSLGGFSGSPVFAYIPPFTLRPDEPTVRPGMSTWLLGVDWGHLPIHEQVKWPDDKAPVNEGWVVESNSGQMAVVPAWKLQELLDHEELAMARACYELWCKPYWNADSLADRVYCGSLFSAFPSRF